MFVDLPTELLDHLIAAAKADDPDHLNGSGPE
jgi:hypothetical protein